jgi:hypothetical protein
MVEADVRESIFLGNAFWICRPLCQMAIQKLVRQKFGQKKDVIKKVHIYTERLYKQFDLCSPDAPVISEHPRLSAYFEG